MTWCSGQPEPTGRWHALGLELAGELRAAALEGDEEQVARRLSELLSMEQLPPAQARALQLRTLSELIHSLRSAAVTDELTGLYNRRGFLQCGTRLLDVLALTRQSGQLLYFDLNNLKEVNDTAGHTAGDTLLRHAADVLRELFPGHGVYEILGRFGGDEFAALTTRVHYAGRDALLSRLARPAAGCAAHARLSLSLGIAWFNPRRPFGIDTLLAMAERAMYEHKRLSRTASTDRTPLAV